MDDAPEVGGYALKSPTRVGLWRAANNIPGGWMMWLFEQYELEHHVISSVDFDGNLADKYDVIVLPSGTTRSQIVNGLNPWRHDDSWQWAHGVGDRGWRKLRQWVRDGGTLVALGTATETARELLSLPIEPVLPRRGQLISPSPRAGSSNGQQRLRDAFQSPAQLANALRDVVDLNDACFRLVDTFDLAKESGDELSEEDDPLAGLGVLFVLSSLARHGRLPDEVKL